METGWKLKGLFASIGSSPIIQPTQTFTVRGGVRCERKGLARRTQCIAIATELFENGGQCVPSEAALGMVFADLTSDTLGTDIVSSDEIRDWDLTPGVDGPVTTVTTMFVLGLAEDGARASPGFDGLNEVAGFLALKAPELANCFFGLSLEPALLCGAHGTMVPPSLLTLVTRRPAHRVLERRASLVVVAERLVLIGAVEVRRCDRERVGLTPEKYRAKTSKNVGALERRWPTGPLMDLEPDGVTLTREGHVRALDLGVPNDRDRSHGAGDTIRRVGDRFTAPQPRELVQQVRQCFGTRSQAATNNIGGEPFRRAPDRKQMDRSRNIVETTIS